MATNPGSGTQATDLVKKENEKCGMGFFFDLKVDKDGYRLLKAVLDALVVVKQ